MTAPSMPSIPLTDAEAAVLRSWLGSNEVHSIAKARRMPVTDVTRILDEVCGFSRHRGRECLAAGHRMPAAVPPPAAPAPPPAPVVPEAPPIEVANPAPKRAPTKRKPAAKRKPPPATTPSGRSVANPDQHRVLSMYARDERITDIARTLRLQLDYVTGIITSLACGDRNTAAAFVARYEATSAAKKQPARRGPAPAPGSVTSEILAELTGLSFRQIDYWSRCGYLRAAGGVGSGTRRLFDPGELRVATLMARLTTAGLIPLAAHRVARGQTELAPGVRIVIDGRTP